MEVRHLFEPGELEGVARRHFFPQGLLTVTLNGLSEREDGTSLLCAKVICGTTSLRVTSLLYFMNQLREKRRLNEEREKNTTATNWTKEITQTSQKLDAICAQNV